jgi:glucan-binding YG repeat protein
MLLFDHCMAKNSFHFQYGFCPCLEKELPQLRKWNQSMAPGFVQVWLWFWFIDSGSMIQTWVHEVPDGRGWHFWDYSIGSIAPGKLSKAQLKHLTENKYYLNPDLL